VLVEVGQATLERSKILGAELLLVGAAVQLERTHGGD
jgi:hypothetical protein